MTATVWVALLGIAGTLIGTLGGAALTNHYASKREGTQWSRQVEEQRRAELLNTYEDFVAKVMTLVEHENTNHSDALRSRARVNFLASSPLAIQANDLYDAATDMRTAYFLGGDDQQKNDAGKAFFDKHDDFVVAVREELGPPSGGELLSLRSSGPVAGSE